MRRRLCILVDKTQLPVMAAPYSGPIVNMRRQEKMTLIEGTRRFGGILAAVLALAVIALLASIPYAMVERFDPGTHGAPAESVVIANIDVLTMADSEILPHRFVVIEEGRISSISESPPENAEGQAVVDGAGLTLMPGLIDMHTHIFDRSDLVNYLASGVTTVRNMMGMPMHLRWRAETASGKFPGPRLVTASPTINGGEFAPFHVFPRDVADARSLVRRYRDCGYDFIKVYDGVQPDIFSAVVDEARKANFDVAGHLPRAMSLDDILGADMVSIEHAEEFYSVFMTEDGAEARLDGVVDQLIAANTTITPTLVAYRNLQLANADPQGFLASVDMDRINPVVQFFDHRAADDFIRNGKPDRIARKMRLMTELTRRMYDRGGAVLLGTDTGPAFTVAGRSLHDEIALNAGAGVGPYQILHSGTAAAAAALQMSGEIGVVAPGARAELVVVAGNPLEDLSTLRRPLGVFANDRYYDRHALDRLEQTGARTSNAYATIGWLLWQHLTRGEVCRVGADKLVDLQD